MHPVLNKMVMNTSTTNTADLNGTNLETIKPKKCLDKQLSYKRPRFRTAKYDPSISFTLQTGESWTFKTENVSLTFCTSIPTKAKSNSKFSVANLRALVQDSSGIHGTIHADEKTGLFTVLKQFA